MEMCYYFHYYYYFLIFPVDIFKNIDHLMLIKAWTYFMYLRRPKANIINQAIFLLQSQRDYIFMQEIYGRNNTFYGNSQSYKYMLLLSATGNVKVVSSPCRHIQKF